MSYRNLMIHLLSFITLVLLTLTSVFASPTKVTHIDDPFHCDPLSIPIEVDEIGDERVFPKDEILQHDTQTTFRPVCTQHDSADIPNQLVTIRNETGRAHKEVWYVADTETRISNWDGFADNLNLFIRPGHAAFRIDHQRSDPTGHHHPLQFESQNFDGIWEVGETWQFVLQDYENTLGIAADSFMSIGVGHASEDLDILNLRPSSGSIITTPIPEPNAIVLLATMFFPFVTRRCHVQ